MKLNFQSVNNPKHPILKISSMKYCALIFSGPGHFHESQPRSDLEHRDKSKQSTLHNTFDNNNEIVALTRQRTLLPYVVTK